MYIGDFDHPLVSILESNIHGLGLFAKEDIPKDTYLGITHEIEPISDIEYSATSITDLGRFINHSPVCNCNIDYSDNTSLLVSLEDIYKGTELLIDYRSFHKIINVESDQLELNSFL